MECKLCFLEVVKNTTRHTEPTAEALAAVECWVCAVWLLLSRLWSGKDYIRPSASGERRDLLLNFLLDNRGVWGRQRHAEEQASLFLLHYRVQARSQPY